MYAIMTRDLKAYSHGPADPRFVADEYTRIKRYVLEPTSLLHQSVLVNCKRKVVGFKLILQIRWDWWKHFLKPEIRWKFDRRISWLVFNLRFENDYGWFPDKIIGDHWAEQQKKSGGENS